MDVHERLELPGRTVTGYVLEAEPGFLKVLTDSREVEIIDTPEVLSRTIQD